MEPAHTALTLDSRIDEIERLAEAIEAFCTAAGWPGEAPAFCLCAEELVTNVVEHGYAGAAGHAIAVTLIADVDGIRMTIVDDAAAFDPTTGIRAELRVEEGVEESDRARAGQVLDTFASAQAAVTIAERDVAVARIERQRVRAGAKSADTGAQSPLVATRFAEQQRAQTHLDRAASSNDQVSSCTSNSGRSRTGRAGSKSMNRAASGRPLLWSRTWPMKANTAHPSVTP